MRTIKLPEKGVEKRLETSGRYAYNRVNVKNN
jgi:hypothetical protein